MESYAKPFVFTFKTASNCYLYDVNKNIICKISHDSFDRLQKGLDLNNELQSFKDAGILEGNYNSKLYHPLTPQIKSLLDTKMNRIVLQLTQQCNLRCHYCIYSDKYYGTRTHSSLRMSSTTLKQSIDFLLAHSAESEELNIGFYGGEPLLCVDLIQETFEYVKSKQISKPVTYAMTTNGLLLKKDVVEMLVLNNVSIQISLDGPREINDSNRTNIHGVGSFDTVLQNLKYIYETFPEYYAKKVNFNAVIDGAHTYDEILPFFCSHPLFKNNEVKFSSINTVIPNSLSFPENKKERILSKRKYAALFYFKSISQPDFSPSKTLEQKFSFWMLESGLSRPALNLSQEHMHSGLCIPGITRLFISADGSFHVCEKVSEMCDDATSIGSLSDGFDYEKIKSLLNICNSSENGCSSCWAIQLCRVCVAMIDLNAPDRNDQLEKFCTSSKNVLKQQLIDYCTYLELKNHYS